MKKKVNLLKTTWFFLNKYKVYFVFLIFLAILTGTIEALNVAVIYPILNEAFVGAGTVSNDSVFLSFIDRFSHVIPVADGLIRYCIMFIILACLAFITRLSYYFFSIKLNSKIVIDTKRDVFNKCMNSDYQFFVDNKQGEIIYKTSIAPSNVGGLIDMLSNFIVDLFLAVSVFALLVTMSWKGTILIILGGIGYYYLTKHLSIKISYRTGRKKVKYSQAETVIINEYASGIKQIKVFETIPYWKSLYDNTLVRFWKYHRKGYFWGKVPETLLILLMYLSIGSVVIFIKLQYPGDFINIIPLVGTFAFSVFIIMPKISKLGNYRMKVMNVFPNVEVVFDMLKDKTYSKIKNGNKKFSGLKSSLAFQNVTFAHKERDILLKDFSIELKKDEITALAGPSGSGKSTVVNLLLRLYDVDNGSIHINNINIKEYDIFTFLKKVGFVSQDTFIFNSSIRDNIAFGKEYTDKEIIESAKKANADEFIRQMPEGYNTVVGDQGVRLSGGEKQRIAIARAMIRKPEILILDEATSSLDNISENAVQGAINKVSKSCTTFIIAHRLSTIQNADIIYVMDRGKIIESGSHKELLKKKGKYWELYNIQKVED